MAKEVEIVARLIADAGKFGQAFDKAIGKVAELQKKIEAVGRTMTRVGKGMAIAGGALIAPLVLAGKTAIDFEAQMIGVRKTTGLTAEETKKLGNVYRDMSTDMKKAGAISLEELTNIGVVAGQLGIKGVENIADFTEQIAKVGTVTELTGAEAADSFAKIGNIAGIAGDNMGKFAKQYGSALNELANNTNATERAILEMQLRIQGTGSTIGMTIPEITGLATSLVNVGVQAEMGGTAISRSMMEMAKGVSFAMDKFVDSFKVGGSAVDAFVKSVGGSVSAVAAQLIKMKDEGDDALRDFAKAAGMSSKEFKEKIEKNAEDAARALIGACSGMSLSLLDLAYKGKDGVGILAFELHGLADTGSKDLETLATMAGVSLEKFKHIVTVNAEEAARRVLENVKKIDESKDHLRIFAETAGMSMDEFAKAFKDKPAEAISAFLKGLGKTKDSSAEVFKTLEQLGWEGIRQIDTLTRVGKAGERLSENIDMANRAFAEGISLQKEYETQTESAKSMLTLLGNQFNDLKIALVSTDEGALKPLIKTIIDLLKVVTAFAKEHPKTVMWIVTITGALGALLGSLGLLLIVLGQLTTAVGTLLPLLAALRAGFIATWAAALGPVGVVAAILALAGAFLYLTGLYRPLWAFIKQIPGWLAELATKVFDFIGQVEVKVLSFLWNQIKTVGGFFVDLPGVIWDAITSQINMLLEIGHVIADKIWEGIKQVWESIKKWFIDQVTALLELPGKIWGKIKGTVGLGSRVMNMALPAVEPVPAARGAIGVAGGNNFSVTINNPLISGDYDARRLADQIVRIIKWRLM